MESKVETILAQVMELFMKYGIKSMTMDDIAGKLGISKKTLYNHVSDKRDLVAKVIKEGLNMEKCYFQEIDEAKLNAIDENFEIMRFVKEKINDTHASIYYDIQNTILQHGSSWRNTRKNFYQDGLNKICKKELKKVTIETILPLT